MENKIKSIDRDLLKALLQGGRIIISKTRTNEKTGVSAHVVIVEMPKDTIIESLSLTEEEKYWRYLVFLHTPDIKGWWHASSNNLTKRQNISKAWDEWSEFKYYLKED